MFPTEHKLYTKAELLRHFEHGTPASGDQAPVEPHPFCLFCNEPLFSKDELYAHCENAHRPCPLCRRRYGITDQTYYRDTEALRKHLASAHLMCTHPECAALPPESVSFDDPMDLSAHRLRMHNDQSARKITAGIGFFEQSVSLDHQGGNNGSGSNRGRRGGAVGVSGGGTRALGRDAMYLDLSSAGESTGANDQQNADGDHAAGSSGGGRGRRERERGGRGRRGGRDRGGHRGGTGSDDVRLDPARGGYDDHQQQQQQQESIFSYIDRENDQMVWCFGLDEYAVACETV